MRFQVHLVHDICDTLVEHDSPLVGFTECLPAIHGFEKFSFTEDSECRPGDPVQLNRFRSPAPPGIDPPTCSFPHKVVSCKICKKHGKRLPEKNGIGRFTYGKFGSSAEHVS